MGGETSTMNPNPTYAKSLQKENHTVTLPGSGRIGPKHRYDPNPTNLRRFLNENLPTTIEATDHIKRSWNLMPQLDPTNKTITINDDMTRNVWRVVMDAESTKKLHEDLKHLMFKVPDANNHEEWKDVLNFAHGLFFTDYITEMPSMFF